MPQPAEVPPFDPGNTLLAQGPAQLALGSADGPAGRVGIVTIRTPSATLTIMLTAADLREWSRLLTALADQLGGGALATASPLDVQALMQARRNGGRPGG